MLTGQPARRSPTSGDGSERVRRRDTAETMSQQNVDKAREFIAAYNRRDFDAAVESFDPET
jgi:hypothetical protein